ncbi:MAG: hypothetical protein ACI9DG_002647 [Oleispira sp.]|jgi:hypothetical protein
MTISDETLNAFIDGELSTLEMNIVRDAIVKQPAVAERVDALAALNSQVHASLSSIDTVPLSKGLDDLRKKLEVSARSEHSSGNADNIIRFPWWRKVQTAVTMPTAIAASVAAIFGFFMNFDTNTNSDALTDWTAINDALTHQRSGAVITTQSGASFEARLTFLNNGGEYCRQFYVKSMNSPALQSIACRVGDDWNLRAAIPAGDQASYQTASSDRSLDAILDTMMEGDPVSPEQEKMVIEHRWQL